MIPAVFQVTFAAIITGAIALLFEHPWTATPGRRGDLLDPVARDPRLGPRLPRRLPAVRALGRDADDARRLPDPGLGDRPRLPRPPGAGRRADHHRDRAGHRRHRAGQQPVRAAAAVRAAPRSRSKPPRRAPPAALSSPPRATAPRRRSAPRPRSGATASERSLASPSRTEPQAAAKTVADSRSGATPGQRRHAQRDEDAQVRGERQPATDRGSPGRRAARSGAGRRRPRARPTATSATEHVAHRIAAYDEHVDLARPDPVDRACRSRSSRRSRARTGSRCRPRPCAPRRRLPRPTARARAPATAAGGPGTRPAA